MRTLLPLVLASALVVTAPVSAQFDSGSDGSDGALALPPNAGVIVLDTQETGNPVFGLDPDGDNVFHFTSIDIPTGTTARLSAAQFGEGKPVGWLATGDVTVAGVIDLDGEPGHAQTVPIVTYSTPGAGGYSGGPGATAGVPPRGGNGPGGGATTGTYGGGAGHLFTGTGGAGGNAYGNRYLLPLIGGSGGAGGVQNGSINGRGGGAGGGALIIAATGSIVIDGTITARGGGVLGSSQAFSGGGGSGGALRLMASIISGAGSFDVNDAGVPTGAASPGRIRIEAFDSPILATGSFLPGASSVAYGRPGPVFLPANAPTVRIVTVDGVPAPLDPTGSYVVPDITIDADVAVTIAIEATNVPLGTTVTLTVNPEEASSFQVQSTPLAGTFENSTATATATIPNGFARLIVNADWTP